VSKKTEVVYDGDCAICQWGANWLLAHDKIGHLDCFPSSNYTWPDADQQLFKTTVVVRTTQGVILTASSAVAFALSQISQPWRILGKWVLILNRIPFLKKFHDLCYYFVAERRVAISNALVRIGVLDESCRVPKS